jgi:hypothetical protein
MSKRDQTNWTLQELWFEQWKLLNPALYSTFDFSDMEIGASFDNAGDAYWRLANGSTATVTHPHSVKCVGNGVLANVAATKGATRALTDQRITKWQLCGAAYWEDAVTPAADWRIFSLVDYPGFFTASFIGFGMFADVSTGFFSFRLRSAGVDTKTVLSTVPFSTGWHRGRMWYDTANLWGQFDDETPILITNLNTDIPAGNLIRFHGAISGTLVSPSTIYIDADSVAGERGP